MQCLYWSWQCTIPNQEVQMGARHPLDHSMASTPHCIKQVHGAQTANSPQIPTWMAPTSNPTTSYQHIGRQTVSIMQAVIWGYAALSQWPTWIVQTSNCHSAITAPNLAPQTRDRSLPLPSTMERPHLNNPPTWSSQPPWAIPTTLHPHLWGPTKNRMVHILQGHFTNAWIQAAE